MQIKPSETTIEKIFAGVDTKFQVPHYQRDYAWTVDNLSELWSDIFSAWKGNTEYFVGAVVFNEENRRETACWEIVDGQQRLASLTVLLSVVRDLSQAFLDSPTHVAFSAVDSSNQRNREKADRALRKVVPHIVHTAEPDNYYLKLNDKDQSLFFEKVQKPNGALLEKADRKPNKPDARILKAVKLLTSKVVDDFLSEPDGFVKLDEFVTYCLTKLLFLRIDVTTDNDAYLLFETLNDRGLDLSIADLVKNRLLLTCGADSAKKGRVYNKWEAITASLRSSRYQPQDFLRFYWIAFHGNSTKREIYAKIKKHLASLSDVEALVDDWTTDATFFARVTARDLAFPVGAVSYSVGSTEQLYAELNSLRYSVCYPLLIYLNRKRPELLPKVLPTIVSYLFRLISIGGFAAGRAEKAFLEALKSARDGKSVSAILGCFKDDETTNVKFSARLIDNSFEENDTAKYILAKLHEHGSGRGLQIKRDAHLEHVLPVKPTKWTAFNAKGKPMESWIYSLGNMTLLEKELNSAIQNDVFSKKVKYFAKQKGAKASAKTTAIPMTWEIAEGHRASGRSWDAAWIEERTKKFAKSACSVWPDPNIAAGAAGRRSRRPRSPASP